jgi:hypothetical protein
MRSATPSTSYGTGPRISPVVHRSLLRRQKNKYKTSLTKVPMHSNKPRKPGRRKAKPPLGEQMKRGSFVEKEKQVLVTVAEKIGSTLGRVAALGQVAKTTRASVKPVRRRLKRTVRTKSVSKTRRARRATRKTRSARRK